MGQTNSSDDIHAQTSALVDMTRQLSRKKLASGQTPAQRSALLAQKAARVELAAARNSVAIAGTLTAIAGQINFESCPLDAAALRGALLTVMDNAADAEKVAEYRRRDAAFQASKRRMVQGVRGLIAASRPGAELSKAAAALGLRRDLLAGGLIGRASPENFAALGRDYNCTVSVTFQGELVQLVNKGVVDEDVLGLIGGQAQDNPELVLSPMSEDKVGQSAARHASEPVTEATAEQGGTGGTQILAQPRIGSSLRRPVSATETRVVAKDEDSET